LMLANCNLYESIPTNLIQNLKSTFQQLKPPVNDYSRALLMILNASLLAYIYSIFWV